MLTIRLFRVGKKNQPFFKIVVTDKRKSSTRGRFVEEVGFYNPKTKEKELKAERMKHWLSVGAIPSATVYNMLVSEKIVEGKKIPKHKIIKKTEAPIESQAEPESKKDEPVSEVVEDQKPEELKTKEVSPEPIETPIAENPGPEEKKIEEVAKD